MKAPPPGWAAWIFAATSVLLGGSLWADTPPRFCGLAAPLPSRPDGVPLASDVSMRSLRFRPAGPKDPHDTFRALSGFHATRLEWTYIEKGSEQERANIARVKAMGILYGGAQSGETCIPRGATPEEDLAIRQSLCRLDLDGHPIVPDFKRVFKGIRSGGCANNPAFREAFLANYRMQIDAGAEILQKDEGSQNHGDALVGIGCYCEHCLRGFRKYLKSTLSPRELENLGVKDVDHFDYAAYLRGADAPPASGGVDWSNEEEVQQARRKVRRTPLFESFEKFQSASMVDFYRWVRSSLDAYAGRRVPMSCNNTSYQNWEAPYYLEFDFGLSELMVASAEPVRMWERAQRALTLGKIQVFGTPKTMGNTHDLSRMLRLRRQVIATAYAAGGLSPVPWDVFEQTGTEENRYFGQPAEYADLFAFIRASDRFLDRYGSAGAFGPGFPQEARFGTLPPVVPEGENPRLFAFVRAIPDDREAAVMIHLVDWNEDKSRPARLRLRTAAFFGEQPIDIRLRTPRDYVAAAHARAEQEAGVLRQPGERRGPRQAAAYETLVQESNLATTTQGDFTVVEIPPVNPWGILVVTAKK